MTTSFVVTVMGTRPAGIGRGPARRSPPTTATGWRAASRVSADVSPDPAGALPVPVSLGNLAMKNLTRVRQLAGTAKDLNRLGGETVRPLARPSAKRAGWRGGWTGTPRTWGASAQARRGGRSGRVIRHPAMEACGCPASGECARPRGPGSHPALCRAGSAQVPRVLSQTKLISEYGIGVRSRVVVRDPG
jgi:hypothetical protein